MNLLADVLHVPDDYPTISDAFNAAAAGDTIIVHPGIYPENLYIDGKDIVIVSLMFTTGDTSYIRQTVVTGAGEFSDNSLFSFVNISSNSRLTGFTLRENITNSGGAISCVYADLVISDNYITMNEAVVANAIMLDQSSPIITRNVITKNRPDSFVSFADGAISIGRGSNPLISHNEISYNVTSGYGGAISIHEGLNPIIEYNLIIGNSADTGGGISISPNSTVTISNNVIANNLAEQGAAISIGHSSNVVLRNNTIAFNRSNNGTIRIANESSLDILNSIIWGNSLPVFNTYSNDSIRVSFTDIQGFFEGMGNFEADPLFADTSQLNFSLNEFSPCIDRGDPKLYLDPDGTVADLGAIYFHQCSDTALPILHLYPSVLDFGPAEIGDTLNKVVVLTNLGGSILNIDSIKSSNKVFTPERDSGIIESCSPLRFTVSFSPNEDTVYTDTLWVFSDDQSNPSLAISLLGIQGARDNFLDSAIAIDGSGMGKGSQRGDQVLLVFSVRTNGPDIVNNYSALKESFSIPGTWGERGNGQWSAGGDSLLIVLGFNFDIQTGDHIDPVGGNLKSVYGYSLTEGVDIGGTFGDGYYFYLPGVVAIDSTVSVEIAVLQSPVADSVDKVEIELEYDSELLSLNDVTTLELIGGWEILELSDSAGFVHFFATGEDIISNFGSIFKLDFVVFPPSNELPLFTEINIMKVTLNDGIVIGIPGNGTINFNPVDIDIPRMDGMPRYYFLSQSYTNPFNPVTTISYSLPRSGEVSLVIYNLIGEEVTTLLDGSHKAGVHEVTWDASNMASGIYFYRLQAGDFVKTRKMLLLK